MKRFLIVTASALILAACGATTAPSYRALDGRSGGYASQQTEANRYVVSYTGVKGMAREQVARYALLRAAEVTLESGNEWFAVIGSHTRKVDLNEVSSALGANGHFLNDGFNFGGFGGGAPPAQAIERWKPDDVAQTIMIIQVGSGDSAAFPGSVTQPEIFDARSTAEEIREGN